jgi:hypothetical protein
MMSWRGSVGFEVLTAASMKMSIFWVVALCSLVEVYRRFRGISCLHNKGGEAIALKKQVPLKRW